MSIPPTLEDELDGHITDVYNVEGGRMGSRGSTGTTWRATPLRGGGGVVHDDPQTTTTTTGTSKVMIKKIYDAYLDVPTATQTYVLIAALRTLAHHPNIISLLEVIPSKHSNGRDIYLIYEYIKHSPILLLHHHKYRSHGSRNKNNHELLLLSCSSRASGHHPTHLINTLHHYHQYTTTYILHQILSAISYMYACGLAHGNICPAHVLLDEDLSVKITHFQHAYAIIKKPSHASGDTDEVEHLNTHIVPPPATNASRCYQAPEHLLGGTCCCDGGYDDLWGAGCILGEMLQRFGEGDDYDDHHGNNNRQTGNKNSTDDAHISSSSSSQPLFGRDNNTSTMVVLESIVTTIGAPSCGIQQYGKDIGSPYVEEIFNNFKNPEISMAPKSDEQVKEAFRGLCPLAPPDALDLLVNLLRLDPTHRITAQQALHHPYLADLPNITIRPPPLGTTSPPPLSDSLLTIRHMTPKGIQEILETSQFLKL